jgi:hypothetical protein
MGGNCCSTFRTNLTNRGVDNKPGRSGGESPSSGSSCTMLAVNTGTVWISVTAVQQPAVVSTDA